MVHNESFDDIEVTIKGHVAIIEIQRPPHNFFDYSLIQQIASAGGWIKRHHSQLYCAGPHWHRHD